MSENTEQGTEIQNDTTAHSLLRQDAAPSIRTRWDEQPGLRDGDPTAPKTDEDDTSGHSLLRQDAAPSIRTRWDEAPGVTGAVKPDTDVQS